MRAGAIISEVGAAGALFADRSKSWRTVCRSAARAGTLYTTRTSLCTLPGTLLPVHLSSGMSAYSVDGCGDVTGLWALECWFISGQGVILELFLSVVTSKRVFLDRVNTLTIEQG